MDNYKEFADEKGRGVVLNFSSRELVIRRGFFSPNNCSSEDINSTLELIKILIESKEARHYSRYINQLADVIVGNLHIIVSSTTVVVNNYRSTGYMIASYLDKTRTLFDNFLNDFNNEK